MPSPKSKFKNESAVKRAVKKALAEHKVYFHMPVQNGMGSPTLDFICCQPYTIQPGDVGKTVGLYLAIETKAPGEKPTPRQEQTMFKIKDANGIATVVGDEATLERLIRFLGKMSS